MPYIPDPLDPSAPIGSTDLASLDDELRAIKQQLVTHNTQINQNTSDIAINTAAIAADVAGLAAYIVSNDAAVAANSVADQAYTDAEIATLIKKLSRLKYGRDVNIVQEEISKRADLAVEPDKSGRS